VARIAVIIPVLSNFKGLTETLQSIRTRHDWTPIIIPQWRQKLALSAAWNEGLAQAKEKNFDYAWVINDDILASKYTLDNLVSFLETCDPQIVMITGCNVAGAFDNPYDILSWNDDEHIASAEGNFAEHPDFSCFLVRPNFCELVGPFDENFFPCWHEDNDMHRRINLLGYKAGSTSAAPYYHFASVTFNQDTNPDKHKGFENSKSYYEAKWGGYIDHEAWVTPYGNAKMSVKDWYVR